MFDDFKNKKYQNYLGEKTYLNNAICIQYLHLFYIFVV